MTTDLEINVPTRHTTTSTRPMIDKPTWFEQLGRRALLARLLKLRHGVISLVEGGVTHTFGRETPTCSLHASLIVHRPQFFRRAAFGGDLGAAEAFMDGDWSCDNLTDLVRILIANSQTQAAQPSRLAWLTEPVRHLGHWLNRNTKSGSRRNIAAHYDLGKGAVAHWWSQDSSPKGHEFTQPGPSALVRSSRGKRRPNGPSVP